jgi:O-antigen/teichoic acid export membrane protein
MSVSRRALDFFGAKRISAEHVSNVLSTLLGRSVTLLLYALVVRYFLNTGSAADFATISLLLLVFSYVQLLDLGVGYAVTQRFGRALATGSSDATSMLSTAVPVYIWCAGAATVVLFSLATPLSTMMFKTAEHAGAIRLLALGILPMFVSAFAAAIFQALNKLVWLNGSRMLLEICKAAAFFYSATSRQAVMYAVGLTVAGTVVRMAFDVWAMRRLVGTLDLFVPRLSESEIRKNFSLGWPMIVVLVLGIVNTLLDRVFVSRVLGPEELAHYTIAYDTNSKAFFLVGAVGAALYTPTLRRAAMARSQRSLLLVAFASVAVVAVAYFAPVAIFARPLLEWWINADVATAAGAATRLGAVMGVAYLAMSVLFNSLQASGRVYLLMVGTVAATLVLIFGLLTIPVASGSEGVMLIVTASFSVQLTVYAIAMRRAAPA